MLPLFFLLSCSKDEQILSSLENQGKNVYNINCTSCHNVDPRQPGSLGPDVAGASVELLKARVMKQSYPQGYQPKRKTRLMPLLPFVEKDIPALHAYLNSFSQLSKK